MTATLWGEDVSICLEQSERVREAETRELGGCLFLELWSVGRVGPS